MYGYDVVIKAQSSIWKRPGEPSSKKAHQVQPNVKVLFTTSFGYSDLVQRELLRDCLRAAIRKNARHYGTISHEYCASWKIIGFFFGDFLTKNNNRNRALAHDIHRTWAPYDFFLPPETEETREKSETYQQLTR